MDISFRGRGLGAWSYVDYKMHEFLPFGGGSRFRVGHTLGRTILETFLVALLSQGKT